MAVSLTTPRPGYLKPWWLEKYSIQTFSWQLQLHNLRCSTAISKNCCRWAEISYKSSEITINNNISVFSLLNLNNSSWCLSDNWRQSGMVKLPVQNAIFEFDKTVFKKQHDKHENRRNHKMIIKWIILLKELSDDGEKEKFKQQLLSISITFMQQQVWCLQTSKQVKVLNPTRFLLA